MVWKATQEDCAGCALAAENKKFSVRDAFRIDLGALLA
jgi:hypothetical protein